jgi:hypothetical protein
MKQHNYQVFYNRLILGDNTVLINRDGKRTLYLNSQVLQYIATDQQVFCKEAEKRMMNLLKRSTILSETSAKERNQFFNKLTRKIPDYSKNVHQ